jgi:hypothetical protein
MYVFCTKIQSLFSEKYTVLFATLYCFAKWVLCIALFTLCYFIREEASKVQQQMMMIIKELEVTRYCAVHINLCTLHEVKEFQREK